MAVAIRTEGLAKYFGDVAALRPLDLEVGEGEVLGYLGPNGAGKTTRSARRTMRGAADASRVRAFVSRRFLARSRSGGEVFRPSPPCFP